MAKDEFKPVVKEQEFVERRNEINILNDKIRLLELIIDRYRSTIEQSETKTIADIKALINQNDETVKKIAEEIESEFKPYIYDQNFLAAARKAHEYVRKIRTVKTPIDFWLMPKDIVKLRAGDPMDKAVLLCSILMGLDNSDSYVVVGVNDGTKVVVTFKYDNEWYLVDPVSNGMIKGSKDEIIAQWLGDEDNIYEFNSMHYNQLKESESE